MIANIIFSIVLLAIFLIPPIIEAVGNKINPIPKIKDKEEERNFSFMKNTQTRNMFECVKK